MLETKTIEVCCYCKRAGCAKGVYKCQDRWRPLATEWVEVSDRLEWLQLADIGESGGEVPPHVFASEMAVTLAAAGLL